MVLVAANFANNILNMRIAENEYNANKQFMQTAGQQIDDVAWTIGRTQTVSYSSKFGNIKFLPLTLNYTFRVHTSSGWQNLTAAGETGIILYNMPVRSYSLGNNYFERVPYSANSSFLLSGSSAPVSQVFCEEKLPMNDGSYNRVVAVPTMRMLSTTLSGTQQNPTTYIKFYLPTLQNTTNPYKSQSLSLTGSGVTKLSVSDVDQVTISIGFPQAPSGFNSSFFNFKSTSITLNSTTTPNVPLHSVVEFYIGQVTVAIGQV
jgi:hypothetical protein